jgi:uncharacterized protein
MALSSCLYRCQVMHQRLSPKRYALRHSLFMCYLDLDELDVLSARLRCFSRNRWNLYSFRDADHLPGSGAAGATLRSRLQQYLSAHAIALPASARVRLLTLPRIAGYVFNPISVYFCFEAGSDTALCAIAEVGNTFGEHKLYLLPQPQADDARLFTLRVPKHYYVSPFSSLTLQFDFRLRVPDEALDIRVDDYDAERRVLRSALRGARRPLSDARLLWYALEFPLMTLQVIGLIHWHALRLWLRGLPWHRKADSPQWQREVLRPHGAQSPLEPPSPPVQS